jgi:hypothetical protein
MDDRAHRVSCRARPLNNYGFEMGGVGWRKARYDDSLVLLSTIRWSFVIVI